MTLLLLLTMMLPQQPANLAEENQRHIELLDARIYAMERQLDRVEMIIDDIKDSTKQLVEATEDTTGLDRTDMLIGLMMALLGLDKGSYWIRARRNGSNGNAKKN